MRDCLVKTLKINQSVFIHNLIDNGDMMNCNLVNILINTSYFIQMLEAKDYEEADIKAYQ